MAKERENEFDAKAHRRALRFLNAARSPEQLLELPVNRMGVREERARKRPDLHEPPLGGEGEIEEAQARQPGPKLLDHRQAERLLRERDKLSPLYGFSSITQLEGVLSRDIVRKLIEQLLHWFDHATYGEWSTPTPLEDNTGRLVCAHAAVLRTGLVLLIQRACWAGTSKTPLWDPATSAVKLPLPTGLTDNLYCCGHAFLSDGSLLAVGGGGDLYDTPTPDMAWRFDPGSETWEATEDRWGNRTRMDYWRWYPTLVTLGDEPGRMLIASGRLKTYDPPAPMEVYFEATGVFATVSVSPDKLFQPTYPGLHLLPGGEVFFAPVGFNNNSEVAAGDPSNEPSAWFDFATDTSGAWTDVGANDRTKGMSVMLLSDAYPFVQVLTVGGGDTASSRTYRAINLSTLAPAWGPAMSLPMSAGQGQPTQRVHPNVVLLPDGTVFVCGGASETEPCWLYDPATLTWSEMDELTYQRRYHSVAALLPNGQVMATGGEGTPGNDMVEVFSPPYLFRGARPVIDAVAPDPVHHGQSFTVETAQAPDIARVVLVRPMAVTHQTDSEQRVIRLSFSQSGPTTLTATAPNGWHPHALAPRGWYMLFVLNGNGVPSEAQFMRLH